MTSPVGKTVVAASGGIVAAAVSALCCVGPLIAVALDVSGAGLAATFEPMRPYFIVATVGSIGYGFHTLRREEAHACTPGTLCASPTARRRMKRLLWIATVVAIPLLTSPWWLPFVL